jgi:hypothetical protein
LEKKVADVETALQQLAHADDREVNRAKAHVEAVWTRLRSAYDEVWVQGEHGTGTS